MASFPSPFYYSSIDQISPISWSPFPCSLSFSFENKSIPGTKLRMYSWTCIGLLVFFHSKHSDANCTTDCLLTHNLSEIVEFMNTSLNLPSILTLLSTRLKCGLFFRPSSLPIDNIFQGTMAQKISIGIGQKDLMRSWVSL